MMARGFKPVGWVAGVAAAALGCYMLSLNVAAERAELTKLEWRIVMAKRDIRTLQTELGTRGRLQQLENWNANVLALSAPTADQFVENELTLARFDQRQPEIGEIPVRMASAEKPAPQAQAPLHYASASAESPKEQPLVHRASMVLREEEPSAKQGRETAAPSAKAAAEPDGKASEAKQPEAPKKKSASAEAKQPAKKKTSLIDDALAKDIREAAKAESKGGAVVR